MWYIEILRHLNADTRMRSRFLEYIFLLFFDLFIPPSGNVVINWHFTYTIFFALIVSLKNRLYIVYLLALLLYRYMVNFVTVIIIINIIILSSLEIMKICINMWWQHMSSCYRINITANMFISMIFLFIRHTFNLKLKKESKLFRRVKYYVIKIS